MASDYDDEDRWRDLIEDIYSDRTGLSGDELLYDETFSRLIEEIELARDAIDEGREYDEPDWVEELFENLDIEDSIWAYLEGDTER